MKNPLKLIIRIIASIIILYFGYAVYKIVRYSHSSDWETYKQYTWLLKDSVRRDIDTVFSFSHVKKTDVLNTIHYKGSKITIWDFKDLVAMDLDKIAFDSNIYLDNAKVTSGEVLDKRSFFRNRNKLWFHF
jgi:hypothetical protein